MQHSKTESEDRNSGFHVATAEGPGAGRFLAAALLDALQSGGSITIERSTGAPVRGSRGVDFVIVQRDGAQAELLRVGLGKTHRVVSAELVRLPAQPPSPDPIDTSSLLAALRVADSVTELRWRAAGNGRDSLEISIRRDNTVQVTVLSL